MVDLETLSTRADAAILVIAAIRFDRNLIYPEKIDENTFQQLDLDIFYERIKINSCTQVGLRVEEKTIQWWNKQDEKIKYESLTNPDRHSLPNVLRRFSAWFKKGGSHGKIWGNGSSFDVTILGEAYHRCGMEPPWKFWHIRDLRTVMDLGKVYSKDLPQFGLHNAKMDCYRQIIGFQRAIKNIDENGV